MLLTTYPFTLAYTAPISIYTAPTLIQTLVSIYTLINAIQGYRKEIINIAKIYTKEQKYSSMNESLNYKLTIFYIIYNRADIL